MARHLLRDYLIQNVSFPARNYIPSYLMAIFLRRVLLYTYVGDTNFNINSVGTLLVATADSTPTAAVPSFAGGTKAGINLASGLEFFVSIPAGTRVVSQVDVGRLLVLRSTSNPTYNSGCFLIDGYDTGTNSYRIAYRTSIFLSGTTVIAAASNNVSLPTGTINVASTSGFPTSGTILVATNAGIQTVNYTGTTSSTFTGCTGGTGTMSTNNSVTASIALPTGTLNVSTTSGFATSGTIFICTPAGRQTVNYTGTTGTTFTGCTGGTGSVLGGSPIVAGIATTIAAGSNGQTLPQTTINVASTTTATTTIASGSNNVRLPTGTINVDSTTGFPTTGIIFVTTNAGTQTVAYTGTTATTFTGCTGGTGLMSTGGSVFAGFSPSGNVFVTTSAGVQQVAYTGRTETTFTGCTGGTGTMSTGGAVFFSPSLPPIEPTDSMNWYLYASDANAPTNGANNTNPAGQYRGNGDSTTPRIILQSPHTTGWQIRICNETNTDQANCPPITMSPGFDGNSAGDFLVAGRHLHTPLYYNSNSGTYSGGAIGCGDPQTLNTTYRHTIIGDDGYGLGVTMIGRRPSNGTTPKSFLVTFGIPEVEPLPLPSNNEARLFTIGSGSGSSNGDFLNDTSWYPGNIGASNLAQGVNMQETKSTTTPIPVSAAVSLITYVSGVGQTGSPIFDGSAGDNPWLGGTELFPVDVIAGTFTGWSGTSFPVQEPRFIGTIPHIREGRANFGEYTLTHDTSRAFMHIRRGMFMFWGGPPILV